MCLFEVKMVQKIGICVYFSLHKLSVIIQLFCAENGKASLVVLILKKKYPMVVFCFNVRARRISFVPIFLILWNFPEILIINMVGAPFYMLTRSHTGKPGSTIANLITPEKD